MLADLAGKVAAAGVNLDLVYVATGNRVVFGADDLEGLRAAARHVVVAVAGEPRRRAVGASGILRR